MDTSSLITGGYGLIGSALANSLEGNVTILTRSTNHKERIQKEDIKVILKDLSDLNKNDLEGIDVIYHFASTVDNYNVLTDPYLDVETNINGTIKLLELCKDLPKIPKLVFLSTFFVYGNEYERTKKPIDENSNTDPLAMYPATKLCTESIIKLYSKLYDIPYLICRLTNVYGENEDFNSKKKGAFNYMIMKAVKGEPLSVYEGGNFERDYIHVDDVLNALLILQKKNVENELFLIGYGEPVYFKDLINNLLEQTDHKSEVTEVQPPKFHTIVGIKNFVADTSKINNLGWKATVDYKTGIRRIVEKYKNLI